MKRVRNSESNEDRITRDLTLINVVLSKLQYRALQIVLVGTSLQCTLGVENSYSKMRQALFKMIRLKMDRRSTKLTRCLDHVESRSIYLGKTIKMIMYVVKVERQAKVKLVRSKVFAIFRAPPGTACSVDTTIRNNTRFASSHGRNLWRELFSLPNEKSSYILSCETTARHESPATESLSVEDGLLLFHSYYFMENKRFFV